MASLAWRILFLPWDTGFTFFHLFLSLLLLGVFGGLGGWLSTAGWFNRILWSVGLAWATTLLLGVLYCPLPLTLVTVETMLFGGAFSRLRSRAALILVGCLMFLVAIPTGLYTFHRFTDIYRLKNLDYRTVASIEFTQLQDKYPYAPYPNDSLRIILTEKQEIRTIAEALGAAAPFSPNHEGPVDPWLAAIRLENGRVLAFKIGNGTRARPDTVFVELGPAYYQTARLYPMLQSRLHWSPRFQP